MNEIKKSEQDADEFSIELEDRLAFRISTLSRLIANWATRTYLERCGVTIIGWRVMVTLSTVGEGSARQICEITKMDKGNVSRSVRDLVSQEAIAENPHPSDGRIMLLSLTEKGRRMVERVKEYSDLREHRLSEIFTADERRQLTSYLDRMKSEAQLMLEELS